jgi:hypothetical protein
MAILDNIDNPSYPESWHRQTPKGYDLHNNENVTNKGLEIPHYQFVEKCCKTCTCNPVTDQMIESQTSFEE